jgi:predicted phosphoribosyltransferase
MSFETREDAGLKLGRHLADRGVRAELVLGLPRGGVVVAAEVARILCLPLDVLVVRKIGHPWHREFAVGALAEGDVVVLDEDSVGKNTAVRVSLQTVIDEETKRLRSYRASFRRAAPIERAGKTVIIVDDGLATGATTEAAIKAARTQQVRRVIVATPVASTNALERLSPVADEVIALLVDPDFVAVGQYYERFSQTTDAEVLALLRASEGGFP